MALWYAVFCKPRAEATAQVNLRRQGYLTYLPLLPTERRRDGKWVPATEPLFPRYLFVSPRDSGHSLAPVRSTLGVTGLVRFGAQPATVPEALISELRAAEAAARAVADSPGDAPHRALFRAGMRVRLAAGPLAGLAGVFERTTGADRVIVLLELLGRSQRIMVERDSIVPTDNLQSSLVDLC